MHIPFGFNIVFLFVVLKDEFLSIWNRSMLNALGLYVPYLIESVERAPLRAHLE
jgi:hypothetical protein